MARTETKSLDIDYIDEDGPLLLKTDSASVKDVGDTSALENDSNSAISSSSGSVVYDLDSTIASIRRGNPLGSVGKASFCSSRTPMSSTCRSIHSNDYHESSTDEVRDTSSEQDGQKKTGIETRDDPTLSLGCITDSLGGLLFCPSLSTRSCLASQSYEDEETLSNNFFNCDDLCGKLPYAQTNQMFPVPKFTMIGSNVNDLQKKIEKEIDQFLGHTKDVTRLCRSQVEQFLELFAYNNVSNLREEQDNNSGPKKLVLRNRNTVIGAKEKRMHILQDNMGGSLISSFANSFQTSLDKPYPMSKAKSMGHEGSKSLDGRNRASKLSRDENIKEHGLMRQKDEFHFDETELFYDSEPDVNEYGNSTRTKFGIVKNRQCLQNHAEVKISSNSPHHGEDLSGSIREDCAETKTHKPSRLSRKYLIKNDDIVVQFIQELTSGFIKLIWHPRTEQHYSSPTYVNAWCELGNNLDDSVVYPKFIWRTTYGSERRHTTRISGSNPSIHNVDLLNIVRVLKPAVIDRAIYPFAKRKKSFLIVSSSGDSFFFEAATEKERNHIVDGIKLTISRLASKIMIGDESVFDEFFSPIGMVGNFAPTFGTDDIRCDPPSEAKKQSNFFKHLTTAESTSERNKRREQGKTSVLK